MLDNPVYSNYLNGVAVAANGAFTLPVMAGLYFVDLEVDPTIHPTYSGVQSAAVAVDRAATVDLGDIVLGLPRGMEQPIPPNGAPTADPQATVDGIPLSDAEPTAGETTVALDDAPTLQQSSPLPDPPGVMTTASAPVPGLLCANGTVVNAKIKVLKNAEIKVPRMGVVHFSCTVRLTLAERRQDVCTGGQDARAPKVST